IRVHPEHVVRDVSTDETELLHLLGKLHPTSDREELRGLRIEPVGADLRDLVEPEETLHPLIERMLVRGCLRNSHQSPLLALQNRDGLFRTPEGLFRIVSNVRKNDDRGLDDVRVLPKEVNSNRLLQLVGAVVEDDVVAFGTSLPVELRICW